jgi:hypothetical protein
MKIERKAPESPSHVERVAPLKPRRGVASPASPDGPRADRVEISEAGRRASSELEATEGNHPLPVPADAPDRIEQIKARVKSGFYVEEQVRIHVAREIVIRGEHRF